MGVNFVCVKLICLEVMVKLLAGSVGINGLRFIQMKIPKPVMILRMMKMTTLANADCYICRGDSKTQSITGGGGRPDFPEHSKANCEEWFGVSRDYSCNKKNHVFITNEVVVTPNLTVVKKDGRQVPFSIEKLRRSISLALDDFSFLHDYKTVDYSLLYSKVVLSEIICGYVDKNKLNAANVDPVKVKSKYISELILDMFFLVTKYDVRFMDGWLRFFVGYNKSRMGYLEGLATYEETFGSINHYMDKVPSLNIKLDKYLLAADLIRSYESENNSCPRCLAHKVELDTRPWNGDIAGGGSRRRVFKCVESKGGCGFRFHTIESVMVGHLMVAKKKREGSGYRVEYFCMEKLKKGLLTAIANYKPKQDALDGRGHELIAERIYHEFLLERTPVSKHLVIESRDIGFRVMGELEKYYCGAVKLRFSLRFNSRLPSGEVKSVKDFENRIAQVLNVPGS